MTKRQRATKKTVPQNPVHNVIVISDLHVGCGFGLFTMDKFDRDEGGSYHPSEMQNTVASWWREFWHEWVPMVCRGEPFCVVCNGDAMDGVHHRSVHQWTHNLEDQCEAAYKMLSPIVELCEGRYYHIRGTEAHVGKSGQEEERLAKRLNAIASKEGHHARWELWMYLGDHLVHFAHHIGVCGSVGYATSAIQKELEQIYVDSALWCREPPAVVCRSHRHRCNETRVPTARGFATSTVTAGWQLKTPFAYRIAGGRITQPQIGGLLIRSGDEDIYTRPKVWELDRPQAERPMYANLSNSA